MKESKIQIKKGLVLVNSIGSILSRFISLFLLLWVQRYLVSRIPTEEYSLYPIFTSILMFLLIARSLFSSGIARFLLKARNEDDNRRITEIVSTTFIVNAFVSILFLIIGLFISDRINYLINIDLSYLDDAKIMMRIVVISFSMRLILSSFESGLIVEQKFILINVITVGMTILRLALLLFLLLEISTRVIWVIFATEVANVLRIVILSIISSRILPQIKIRFDAINFHLLRDIINFGIWSFISQISNRIRSFINPILLNLYSTPYDVSIHYLGSIASKQIYELGSLATHTLLPSLTAMYESEQFYRLSRVYIRYLRIFLWAYLLIGAPLIAYHQEIMLLYVGHEYEAAGMIMLLLLVSSSFGHIYTTLSRIAYAMNSMRTFSFLSLICQLINIVLTLFFIKRLKFGALGAVYATSLVRFFLEFPIFSIWGMKKLNLTFGQIILDGFIKGILPTMVSVFIMIILKKFNHDLNLYSLLFFMLLGIIAYFFTVFLFSASKEDKSDFKNLYYKIIRKFR